MPDFSGFIRFVVFFLLSSPPGFTPQITSQLHEDAQCEYSTSVWLASVCSLCFSCPSPSCLVFLGCAALDLPSRSRSRCLADGRLAVDETPTWSSVSGR
ncbi:hypothetical protein LX36DRAFT_662647 [Colletotrichum falcatum]|nr:hypothetical protein LX36DRAFT_662647 [Colletotrichum falcatum]